MSFNDQVLDDELHNQIPGQLPIEILKEINVVKAHLNKDIEHIKKGRVALIVLAVLSLAGTAVTALFMNEGLDSITLVTAFILVLLYTGCAIGVKFNPKAALIAGLAVYLLVWLLSIIGDPSYAFRGIIWKGLFIYFLGTGINGALGFHKRTDKLFRLGASAEDLEKAKKFEYVPMSRLH